MKLSMPMLEPLVQDYVDTVGKLDKNSFCLRLKTPVLVFLAEQESCAFQQATTHMVSEETIRTNQNINKTLHHRMPVIELCSDQSNSTYRFEVGRSEANSLVILDETVSSHHAVLSTECEGFNTVKDLGSTNGTTINGTLLVEGRTAKLHNGDIIAFGDSEYMYFTPAGLYDAIKGSIIRPNESNQK